MKRLAILVIVISAAIGLVIKTGDDVTISGISSGAFMCMQMHIANSEIIRGAGIFGGGPYHCAKGSLSNLLQKSAVDLDSNSEENCEMELLMEEQQKSLMNCMADGSKIDLTEIKKIIKDYEIQGKIDSTSNLIGNKVYIFSGTSDDLVVSKVIDQTENLYRDLGATIKTKYDINAGHVMPTLNYGVTCSSSLFPKIGKCNFNGAFEALNYLFDGKLKQNSGKFDKRNLYSITQNQSGTSMGPKAYVYVPDACKEVDANCPLHVAFHACQQTVDDIQLQYVEKIGYNEIAEDNNLVILYPQAVASGVFNPIGCWDTYGYLNDDFANKKGPQIIEVNRLISGLKSGSIELTQVKQKKGKIPILNT